MEATQMSGQAASGDDSRLALSRIHSRLCLLAILICGGLAMGRNGVANEQAKTVLIVMDERPQMETLAEFLRAKGKLEVEIVDQASLPADFSSYSAVVGYIHKTLEEKTELALIDYTKNGGRYVCVHHSISSKKAQNKYYFDFLGIRLDAPEEAKSPPRPGGHYAWRHPADVTIVNLDPRHYITNHNIEWNETATYASSDSPSAEREYPSMTLKDSEVYLNHKFIDGREKTVLCGFKYFDDRNNQLYMQDRAAWVKAQGKGHIIYFKMGHSGEEFENPNISQMILNAIEWRAE
jgi:hypothetical protein